MKTGLRKVDLNKKRGVGGMTQLNANAANPCHICYWINTSLVGYSYVDIISSIISINGQLVLHCWIHLMVGLTWLFPSLVGYSYVDIFVMPQASLCIFCKTKAVSLNWCCASLVLFFWCYKSCTIDFVGTLHCRPFFWGMHNGNMVGKRSVLVIPFFWETDIGHSYKYVCLCCGKQNLAQPEGVCFCCDIGYIAFFFVMPQASLWRLCRT